MIAAKRTEKLANEWQEMASRVTAPWCPLRINSLREGCPCQFVIINNEYFNDGCHGTSWPGACQDSFKR